MTTSNSLYSHRKQNSFIATCLKDSKFRNAAFLTYLIKGHYKIPRQLNHQKTTESCSKERKARAIKTNQMLLSNHNPNLTPNYSNYTKTRAGFPAQATILYLAMSNITPYCRKKIWLVFVRGSWKGDSKSLEFPLDQECLCYSWAREITLELMLRDEKTRNGGWSPERPAMWFESWGYKLAQSWGEEAGNWVHPQWKLSIWNPLQPHPLCLFIWMVLIYIL